MTRLVAVVVVLVILNHLSPTGPTHGGPRKHCIYMFQKAFCENLATDTADGTVYAFHWMRESQNGIGAKQEKRK